MAQETGAAGAATVTAAWSGAALILQQSGTFLLGLPVGQLEVQQSLAFAGLLAKLVCAARPKATGRINAQRKMTPGFITGTITPPSYDFKALGALQVLASRC
ncbi:MAG: hypothetical protein M0D55_06975 [Elusimicrobiota bacterium]|nr:MAG: hypothetical protein M0D55_06975 [Elusimicrobiota bacterium]